MSTWTSTALQALEGYLERNRLHVATTGADAEEVVADLRRHVEEEVVAMKLPVVTEADVHRIVTRIGAVPEIEPTESPSRPARKRKFDPGFGSIPSIFLLAFGVALPVITIVFELTTHLCAGVLFDPIPTWFHVLLVGIVPLANLSAWGILRDPERSAPRWLWLANGAACGASLFYTIIFFPLMFFAVIGIVYFGMGFLPLTPVISFSATLVFREHLRKKSLDAAPLSGVAWTWTGAASLLLLTALALPGPLTRHWIDQAGSDDLAQSNRAIQQLRRWGSEQTILMECYGRANRLWLELFNGQRPNPEAARQVYYRVTGKAFNSAPPPLSKYQHAGRELFGEFEWDRDLGGDAVAGRVKGLSLIQSRMDGLCEPQEGWAYIEWILEFQNDHERRQREARMQVQLPPGGAVSRLTLWINGEEREAAFAGRAQVREAYQKVAIEQRRDPVLVTTCGPDRVLVQCFPIQPGGGTMKIRLGITAPLLIESGDMAAVKLPSIIERNFGSRASFEHHLWLESRDQPIAHSTAGLSVAPSKEGSFGIRGRLSQAQMNSADAVLRFALPQSFAPVFARDHRGDERAVISQKIATLQSKTPTRIAIVLNGSEAMTEHLPQIAKALNGLPSAPEIALWFAQDGVRQLFDRSWNMGEPLPEIIGKLRGMGGQDDVPALLQAWEWAAAKEESAILWIHSAQPVLMESIEALAQRMEWRGAKRGPALIDVATEPGPNRIAEKLSHIDGIVSLPRLGNLRQDLERLFAQWSGRQPLRGWTRSVDQGVSDESTDGMSGSSHIVRLWALDKIKSLIGSRRVADAVRLAALYQLVTPVSGAVVLETQKQFRAAGLTPADAASVPMVPEPGTWALLIVGGCALIWLRWRKRSTASRICSKKRRQYYA